jgi:hypothetical protein
VWEEEVTRDVQDTVSSMSLALALRPRRQAPNRRAFVSFSDSDMEPTTRSVSDLAALPQGYRRLDVRGESVTRISAIPMDRRSSVYSQRISAIPAGLPTSPSMDRLPSGMSRHTPSEYSTFRTGRCASRHLFVCLAAGCHLTKFANLPQLGT